jgi:DNA-binding MarR family transcriptional regulator
MLTPREKEIYLSAIEKSQRISEVTESLSICSSDVRTILDDFEQQDLILYSFDKESFLSLATKYKK